MESNTSYASYIQVFRKQYSIILYLMIILQANLDCVQVCKIEPEKVIPTEYFDTDFLQTLDDYSNDRFED